MPEKFWEKYERLEEIKDGNSNTNTYSARINATVKEIKAKDKDDYIRISRRIEQLKHKIKIYDVMEENDIIYIVLDKNEEQNKVNEFLFSEKQNIIKEGEIDGAPIKKKKYLNYLKRRNQCVK